MSERSAGARRRLQTTDHTENTWHLFLFFVCSSLRYSALTASWSIVALLLLLLLSSSAFIILEPLQRRSCRRATAGLRRSWHMCKVRR